MKTVILCYKFPRLLVIPSSKKNIYTSEASALFFSLSLIKMTRSLLTLIIIFLNIFKILVFKTLCCYSIPSEAPNVILLFLELNRIYNINQ